MPVLDLSSDSESSSSDQRAYGWRGLGPSIPHLKSGLLQLPIPKILLSRPVNQFLEVTLPFCIDLIPGCSIL